MANHELGAVIQDELAEKDTDFMALLLKSDQYLKKKEVTKFLHWSELGLHSDLKRERKCLER